MRRGVFRQGAKRLALVIPPIRQLAEWANMLAVENGRLASELAEVKAEKNALSEQLAVTARLITESRQPPKSEAVFVGHANEPPYPEAAFKLFDGEWSSRVPGFGFGNAELFDDVRIKWLESRCGGFAGKRILELGPLEGGHTFMMATRGAAQVTAVESNRRAFVRCLIARNALGFNANFLLGDFQKYLSQCRIQYDLVLASGVLYHMVDPVALLRDIARVGEEVCIWTHYYDAEAINECDNLRGKFSSEPEIEHVGQVVIAKYRQLYLDALNWGGFSGGSVSYSYWLTREGLLACFEALGLTVETAMDQKDHPNGPCILIHARRKERSTL